MEEAIAKIQCWMVEHGYQLKEYCNTMEDLLQDLVVQAKTAEFEEDVKPQQPGNKN